VQPLDPVEPLELVEVLVPVELLVLDELIPLEWPVELALFELVLMVLAVDPVDPPGPLSSEHRPNAEHVSPLQQGDAPEQLAPAPPHCPPPVVVPPPLPQPAAPSARANPTRRKAPKMDLRMPSSSSGAQEDRANGRRCRRLLCPPSLEANDTGLRALSQQGEAAAAEHTDRADQLRQRLGDHPTHA
jgi:hypothetical protein